MMVIINKIKTQSRNRDVSATTTYVCNCLAENDWSADVYLSSLILLLVATNKKMVLALNKLSVYSQLDAANHERETHVRALFYLVRAAIYNPLPLVKEAALKVDAILEQYTLSITYESFNDETADIESLLVDLSDADIVTACTVIQGVSEVIVSLSDAEEAFEALALSQFESEVARREITSATELKQILLAQINEDLVPYLNTMTKVNPAQYEATSATISEIITTNNELVKRRSSGSDTDSLD